ncbi:MAG: phosphomannomutase [Pseudomonadota bacterium]
MSTITPGQLSALPPTYFTAVVAGQNSSAWQMSGMRGRTPPCPPGSSGNGRGSDDFSITINELMKTSDVKFGTSGARGLAHKMTDFVCFAYTMGFLQYLFNNEQIKKGDAVAIAGDLRPSTSRIMTAVSTAASYLGYQVINTGTIPSPAAAFYGIQRGIPSVMVTGSHIPDDRNGIKFNKANGEILKDDEAGIRKQAVRIPLSLFNENGFLTEEARQPLGNVERNAEEMFIKRYLDLFSASALVGKRVGLYQHSAVGRDMLHRVLADLGAKVTCLGRSEKFIPVDTEAIRDEDVKLAKQWAKEHGFDAIVSTDGDSDRPLVAGCDGKWLRGDVLGILVAKFLNADSVTTPVSSNTAVEKLGAFKEVNRTRIGSPYVISSMMRAVEAGFRRVVGYEANGGFLTATDMDLEDKMLSALPTRDAFLPILSAILLADSEGKTIEELVTTLPARFTASNRLKNFATERSKAILAKFDSGDRSADLAAVNAVFGKQFGQAADVDYTDGIRITFENGEIVHLRPSGNAPEFRVYSEASSEDRAREINDIGLDIVRGLG